MSDTVITVEHLSKKYRLGQIGVDSLREAAEAWWHRLRGRDPAEHMGELTEHGAERMAHGKTGTATEGIEHQGREGSEGGEEGMLAAQRGTSLPLRASVQESVSDDEIWALKDVSFEVKRGEVLGIIGRNGAGKSTLLKILTRITEPTSGRAIMRGRVASLLEVGTGFHPELTGRENIYLNGAILGMKKREIASKFDEIVAFAEIEKFIDTPVKRYSSGMYVRLAFAVAAHLEAEILLVDEVLAVGDLLFQKKCMGKMTEAAGKGRTILLVSHNMPAIKNLSTHAVFLSLGSIDMYDSVDTVIRRYLADGQVLLDSPLSERTERKGTGIVRFHSVSIRRPDGAKAGVVCCGDGVMFRIRLLGGPVQNFHLSIGIDNQFGQRITHLSTEVLGQVFRVFKPLADVVDVTLPKLSLMPGRYTCTLFCSVNGAVADWIEKAFRFDVDAGDYFGTGRLLPTTQGDCIVEHSFSLRCGE